MKSVSSSQYSVNSSERSPQRSNGKKSMVAKARRTVRRLSHNTGKVSREIHDFMLKDKFAESLGIELVELREGYSKCAMTVTDQMVNAHNIAHGAAIFTIADYAFAAACNSYGQTALALEVKINFLDAVKVGTKLTAEAKEESLSRRIGLYHLTVMDANGKLVAAAQATAYRKNESFVGTSKQGNR